ncbi:MAG TPA: hypothetical protein ENK55_01750 [Actinobacteria bacterium]|nr:hypothetical protein [Actinomycetota bacterium]
MTDTTPSTDTTTATWLRLARGAAVAMVLWAVMVHVTARMLIPPVLVIGIVSAGFVPFLAGSRRKLGLGVAVFYVLATAGNLPILLDELTHPTSTPAFVLALLSTTAATTATIAGLGAFFRWPTAPVRVVAVAAVAVFVVGVGTSIALSSSTENAVALPGDVTVVAENVAYAPDTIEVGADATGIWIENRDGIRHTFTIEELGVDLEIPALKASRIDLDAPPGTYAIVCTVPGHENMTGTLVVEG